MENKTISNGEVAPCCQDEANREVIQKRGDLVVMRCKVCDRKHYELSVDPGKIFAKSA